MAAAASGRIPDRRGSSPVRVRVPRVGVSRPRAARNAAGSSSHPPARRAKYLLRLDWPDGEAGAAASDDARPRLAYPPMVLPVSPHMPQSTLVALDVRLRSLMGGPAVVDGHARLSIVPLVTPDELPLMSDRRQRWVLARTTEAPQDAQPKPPGEGRYRWVCPLCPTLPTPLPSSAHDLSVHLRREHAGQLMLVCGLCTGTETFVSFSEARAHVAAEHGPGPVDDLDGWGLARGEGGPSRSADRRSGD